MPIRFEVFTKEIGLWWRPNMLFGFTAGPLVGGALGSAGLLKLALALDAI